MVASINSMWLGLGTIILGWTVLILVGLGVKSILARRIYRPAYQSRTIVSQRASAPPQGIELQHLNGQQGTYGLTYHQYNFKGVRGRVKILESGNTK